MPRQTIYKRDNWNEKLEVLKGWARDGLTDEQIAANMGIHVSTLYEYKNKYPEVNESLKKGKAVVDYEVENALLQQALQGNTTAQIFWLKNRRPKKWRDKTSQEISGPDGGPVQIEEDLSTYSMEELKEMAGMGDD